MVHLMRFYMDLNWVLRYSVGHIDRFAFVLWPDSNKLRFHSCVWSQMACIPKSLSCFNVAQPGRKWGFICNDFIVKKTNTAIWYNSSVLMYEWILFLKFNVVISGTELSSITVGMIAGTPVENAICRSITSVKPKDFIAFMYLKLKQGIYWYSSCNIPMLAFNRSPESSRLYGVDIIKQHAIFGRFTPIIHSFLRCEALTLVIDLTSKAINENENCNR